MTAPITMKEDAILRTRIVGTEVLTSTGIDNSGVVKVAGIGIGAVIVVVVGSKEIRKIERESQLSKTKIPTMKREEILKKSEEKILRRLRKWRLSLISRSFLIGKRKSWRRPSKSSKKPVSHVVI